MIERHWVCVFFDRLIAVSEKSCVAAGRCVWRRAVPLGRRMGVVNEWYCSIAGLREGKAHKLYNVCFVGVGGIELSSVCNLLRCILIVCVITPWCNGSGTIQSFPSLSRAHSRPSRRAHDIRRKTPCCLAAFQNQYRSGAAFEKCNCAAFVLYAETHRCVYFEFVVKIFYKCLDRWCFIMIDVSSWSDRTELPAPQRPATVWFHRFIVLVIVYYISLH